MEAKHPVLLATAVGHALLSLGHTAKGLEQFKHPSLAQIPTILRSTLKLGWYEGSVFFAIAGLLNYKWSQTGLVGGVDKAIAGILTMLLLGVATRYYKAGDKPTGFILAAVGVLQGLGIKNALCLCVVLAVQSVSGFRGSIDHLHNSSDRFI